MIRRRFSFLCLACTAAFVSTSNAAVISVDTANHPLGGTSEITINISLLGLQTISISDVSLTGGADVDYLLDGSNSGTIQVLPGNNFLLEDVNQAFAGTFLSGQFQTIGVGAELLLGPVNVTNRNFTIDSTTTGGLNLASGNLLLTITGGALAGALTAALGTNVVLVDLGDDPVGVEFADLGTASVAATTDQDTTGLNPLGPEVNIPLDFATSLELEGIALNVTTSGNIFIGAVPEFGSIGLVSAAVAGLGAFIGLRRRKA